MKAPKDKFPEERRGKEKLEEEWGGVALSYVLMHSEFQCLAREEQSA